MGAGLSPEGHDAASSEAWGKVIPKQSCTHRAESPCVLSGSQINATAGGENEIWAPPWRAPGCRGWTRSSLSVPGGHTWSSLSVQEPCGYQHPLCKLGVPQSVDSLLYTSDRVWMLTGLSTVQTWSKWCLHCVVRGTSAGVQHRCSLPRPTSYRQQR